MVFNILAFISLLTVITLLRRLVNIFPSLLACMIRAKENFNIEKSVKISTDRNKVAFAMTMPFVLTVTRFRLFSLEFMNGMDESIRICILSGIFCSYVLLRRIMSYLVRPHYMKPEKYSTAVNAAYTFFIILTLILILTGGIMSFLDCSHESIHNAMIWISGCIYLLFLLRKYQIFLTSCSIFTAFLYLCALEIIPTGILVISAVIF